MLNKVASTLILGTVLCATAALANPLDTETKPAPYRFKTILAASTAPDPDEGKNIGLNSDEGTITIDNDSPTYKYTLRAECNFGRAGKISIREHFSNENDGFTYDGKLGKDGKGTGGKEGKAEAKLAAAATRYLEIKIDGLNTLCPRSSYTLTLHQFNNIKCKCKNVGGLITGASSIISESIATSSQGDVQAQIANGKVEGLALLPVNTTPISALGGSCVLTLNDNCYGGRKSCKKKKNNKCKPACPVKLCAPITLITYT